MPSQIAPGPSTVLCSPTTNGAPFPMRPTSAPQPPLTGQMLSAAQPLGVMFAPAQLGLRLPYEISPVASIVARWPPVSVTPVSRNGVVAGTESVFVPAPASDEPTSRRAASTARARIAEQQIVLLNGSPSARFSALRPQSAAAPSRQRTPG